MGVKDPNFQLNSFLTKSQNYLENFTIENQKMIIDFVKTEENFHDKNIRENLLKRITHLTSLQDQVVKSLKYPKKEFKKEKIEEDLEEEDFDEFDLELLED